MAKQDPKQAIEYLLGEIVAGQKTTAKEIHTIRTNQILIIEEGKKRDAIINSRLDKLETKNAFNKGFIAAITTIGATMGAAIVAFSKYIWGLLILPH